MSIFERLAYTDPETLRALARAGLLVIADHLPVGWAKLMRRAAYRRVRGRLREVRGA